MEPITNWNEIVENIKEFNKIFEYRKNPAYERFGKFFHWYYLPEEDLWGPSKFIGFKDITIYNYYGEGHGGIAKKALNKYFRIVLPDVDIYEDLEFKLLSFAKSLGKNICKKTFQGTGGMYIPKDEYKKLVPPLY